MDVNNKINCYIHNKFDIEVIDGETGKIKQKAEAYNIVLDNLWHYIIETTTSFGTYIQYGTGSGTPITSRTSLFSLYSGKSITQTELTCDYVNRIATRRGYINLPLSEAVGQNITEVGLAAGGGNGSLSTHAMLQDMNGNTISIQKTEFDIINIYATIYCHWDLPPSNMGFYPQLGLLNSLVGSNNVFGSFTGGLAQTMYRTGSTMKTWNKTATSLANKTITYTMPRYTQSEGNVSRGGEWIIGSGNYEGIGMKQGNNAWSPFTITNESVGTGDGTTTKFNTKFNAPYNATVYINGVAQSSSDVTVLNKMLPSYFVSYAWESPDENNLILKPVRWGTQVSVAWYETRVILYNPYYATDGFIQFSQASVGGMSSNWCELSASNDLTNWVSVGSNYGLINIPVDYQHYKYFKAYIRTNFEGYFQTDTYTFDTDPYNIIFTNPPADGDVITIDYTTDCLPKDSDHVMDATITFVFGDYTPTP